MSDNITAMSNTTFPATAWTQIEAAKGKSKEARQKRDELCTLYYAPVFGFIARQIRDRHRAQDLTNDFFAQLWENPTVIEKADRRLGKFRSYLSQRLKWFIMDQFKKDSRRPGNAILNEQNEKHSKALTIDSGSGRRYGIQRRVGEADVESSARPPGRKISR